MKKGARHTEESKMKISDSVRKYYEQRETQEERELRLKNQREATIVVKNIKKRLYKSFKEGNLIFF